MALTLKQRLSLFSSLLILLLVLVSGVNYYQLSQLEQHIRSQSQRIDTLNDSMLTLRTAQVHFKIQVQEWKNILLRGNNLEAFDRYRQQFDQQAASTDTLLQTAENTLPQLGINDIDITAIRQAMRTLNGEYRLALQGFDPDRADMGREIDQRLRGVDRAANTLLDEASDKLLQHHQQAVSQHDEQQAAQFRLTLIWTGSTLLCLVFASLAILLLLSRQLLREIGNDPRAARKLLARIADGDLRSPPLPAPRGSIQDSINQMSSKLATTLAQVQEASQQLVAAAGQLTDSSQLLAQSSIDTANSVEESASALDEMATSIMLANENTSSTARIAEDAASHAQRGQVIMQETVSRLRDITREIQLVDDIAYKTGLLALNAAIEAARAGDHGKSFAVVAVEVRKLADRSLQIANSIAESTQNNLAQAETASRALQDISSGSDQTSTLVLEISETSRQLADGVSHISQAIQQMNSATQQNASISEELAATAEQVNSMARQLEQHIDSFHLPSQRQQLALTPQLPRLTT